MDTPLDQLKTAPYLVYQNQAYANTRSNRGWIRERKKIDRTHKLKNRIVFLTLIVVAIVALLVSFN